MANHSYTTHAEIWEQNATIRNRPRRLIEDDDLGFYPEERQPLCFDPVIVKLSSTVKDYILLQSLYKYINDIIIFETEIVNKTALKIATGRFNFDFSFAERHDAMSVVIDEDYHAFVAMDFQNQLEKITGIVPFQVCNEIELSKAIPKAISTLDKKYQEGMELIAVAISENTVTSDVAAFSRDNTIKRSIKGIMSDHLADEGRHSKFWIEMVKIYWNGIDEDARIAIGEALPTFLKEYLTSEVQQKFDASLVKQIELPEMVKSKIIENMVSSFPITSHHPMMANIRKFFVKSGMLDHAPTKKILSQYYKD